MEEMMKKMEKYDKLDTKLHQLETKHGEKLRLLETNRSTPSLPGQRSIPKTCDELRRLEPYLPSGDYIIDPDGFGRGESPISVYCNMKTGSTSLPHDTEQNIRVTQCRDPGCYSHFVSYNVPMKQIIALTELSAKCRQEIQYRCTSAPLWRNGINYAWWNDRHSKPHYYWSGNNDTLHYCHCGMNEECVNSTLSCNCDLDSPIQLIDRGFLTDKQILPVTSLHFGHTNNYLSSGEHYLGKFECSGYIPIPKVARSCQDLWHVGHTLTGFYTVEGSSQLQKVHCDMRKLPGEPGFETVIGSEDIQKNPVYFHVSSGTSYSTLNTYVPYENEHLNIGQSMNLTSGLFTAPTSGTYFFTFLGLSQPSFADFWAFLFKNEERIVGSYTYAGRDEMVSILTTINLSKGDKVGIKVGKSSLYSHIYNKWTQFTGFLLSEHLERVSG